MVRINQTIANFSDPEEKETYIIKEVKEVDATGLKGLAVSFYPTDPTPDTDKIEYKATLWLGKKTTTSNSKLGAFMSAFAEYFENEGQSEEQCLKRLRRGGITLQKATELINESKELWSEE